MGHVTSTTLITRLTSGVGKVPPTSTSIKVRRHMTSCAMSILPKQPKLKIWDPLAVGFGWVSCCWYYHWNSATGTTDKSAHANVDFMPWWLNDVYWNDQIAGSRSLDAFDLH